jgi:hypothetical protein
MQEAELTGSACSAQARIISFVTRRTRCEIASADGGFATPRLCRSWLKPSHAAIRSSAASSASSLTTSFCSPSDLKAEASPSCGLDQIFADIRISEEARKIGATHKDVRGRPLTSDDFPLLLGMKIA